MAEVNTQKLIEVREWLRQELDTCVSFGSSTAWTRSTEAFTPASTAKARCIPPTKASGCKDVAHGCSRICAICTAGRPGVDGGGEELFGLLEDHCINHDAGGRLYFTVTGDGKPLRQRRYCFSEGFYAIANAEYYGVTGEAEHSSEHAALTT